MVKRQTTPQEELLSCMIRFDISTLVEVLSFHLEHRLHLACTECIKSFLDSLASTEIVRDVHTVDYL